LFSSQAEGAVNALVSLTSDEQGGKRDGIGKEWSDEVSRNLVLLRLGISGVSALFDPKWMAGGETADRGKASDEDTEMKDSSDGGDSYDNGETDDEPKTAHRYPAGFAFKSDEDPLYVSMHELRDRIGNTLHRVHVFLTSKQEDDVACFNALYTVRYLIFQQFYMLTVVRPIALGSLMWVSNGRHMSWTESHIFTQRRREYSRSAAFANVTLDLL
jgi:proteasome activator subunit 4